MPSEKVRTDFNIEGSLDMRAILTLPGVLQNSEGVSADAAILSELVQQSMQEALEGVLKMRRQEGEALRADMLQNLAGIELEHRSYSRIERKLRCRTPGAFA